MRAFLPLLGVILFVLYLSAVPNTVGSSRFRQKILRFVTPVIDNFVLLFWLEKIQDEIRKIGTILLSAGGVALAINNPGNPVEPRSAAIAILAGSVLLLVGSLRTDNEKEKSND